VDDFVSRLLAAIEETEQLAKACGEPGLYGSWYYAVGGETVRSAGNDHVACGPWNGPVEADYARHIVRHDPEAVLRRCAADRRTVERHMPRVAVQGPYEGELICGCSDGADEWHATRFPCEDVRDRADAYGLSDHQEGEE
jgi:hypothetical protein